MSIHETIKDELKTAMKERNTGKVDTLRSVLNAFTQELVSQGKTPRDEVDDDTAITVIRRLVKQRTDSIEQYEQAGYEERAEAERAERTLLEAYLPQMMSEEEIGSVAREKIAELGVSDPSEAGTVMKHLMADLKGKADGATVKNVVHRLLQGENA